jgi:hypothetical protein
MITNELLSDLVVTLGLSKALIAIEAALKFKNAKAVKAVLHHSFSSVDELQQLISGNVAMDMHLSEIRKDSLREQTKLLEEKKKQEDEELKEAES